MESNRIEKLFEPFEVRSLSWIQITKRIKDNFGLKFYLNRLESDWLTSEKKNPTKDTLDFIKTIENQKEVKVISINKITEKQKQECINSVIKNTKSF